MQKPMPIYSSIDISTAGKSFIPQVVADPSFQKNGVLYGDKSDWYWAVVNPYKHPLDVWQKKTTGPLGFLKAYIDSAHALNAVVFTNGPMMETSPPGRGSTYEAAYLALLALTIATTGSLLAYLFPWFWALVGTVVVGWMYPWLLALLFFTGGTPFGGIYSAAVPVATSGMKYNDHYFGRNGIPFSSYSVGPDPTPVLTEVIGGLIPVVLKFVAQTATTSTSYGNWSKTDGISGWGLIPFTDPGSPMPGDWLQGVKLTWEGQEEPLDGVILAIGHNRRISSGSGLLSTWASVASQIWSWIAGPPAYMGALGPMLVSVGARDAVVMDGGDSIMMGAVSDDMVGPPPPYKDVWQIYGFKC